MKITTWLDRFVFAIVLIAALQVPVLSDQYRQYLAGYVDALESQVKNWENLARQFNLANIEQLIELFEKNPDQVVNADAELKKSTIQELATQKEALQLFSSDNYLSKTLHILSPQHAETTKKVLENFRPGIPLDPLSIAYSLILAIIVELALLLPLLGIRRIFRKTSHEAYND